MYVRKAKGNSWLTQKRDIPPSVRLPVFRDESQLYESYDAEKEAENSANQAYDGVQKAVNLISRRYAFIKAKS